MNFTPFWGVDHNSDVLCEVLHHLTVKISLTPRLWTVFGRLRFQSWLSSFQSLCMMTYGRLSCIENENIWSEGRSSNYIGRSPKTISRFIHAFASASTYQ